MKHSMSMQYFICTQFGSRVNICPCLDENDYSYPLNLLSWKSGWKNNTMNICISSTEIPPSLTFCHICFIFLFRYIYEHIYYCQTICQFHASSWFHMLIFPPWKLHHPHTKNKDIFLKSHKAIVTPRKINQNFIISKILFSHFPHCPKNVFYSCFFSF